MAKKTAKAKALGDPEVYPSDEVLATHLRRSRAAFSELFAEIRAEHPDFVERWKYYNDGKSWLLNLSRKKKTLCWLAVHEGYFTTAFYFAARTEGAVLGSDLSEELKGQYRVAAEKKFPGIVLRIGSKKDIAAFRSLLALKLANP